MLQITKIKKRIETNLKLSRQTNQRKALFAMKTITQKMKFRESMLRYAEKNGVTKASIKYNVNRQYVYRWKNRYDGTLESLADRSHRPKSHPKQHTEDEIKLIKDMRRRNPNAGLVVFWVKLMERGYTRTITGLYRVLRRLDQMPVHLPNPKYIAKPYEEMTYPGQRVQIDVKHVPASCITAQDDHRSHKYYQYTAIDEYSRFRYVEGFDEISTYSSKTFLENMLKAFPFSVECVQTDNGPEFTNRFTSKRDAPTLFEACLKQRGIVHKLIRPFTPRHNGKVERSHRKDNEYFYASHKFYSLEDFKKQLTVHNRKYNHFPMRPLGWSSPASFLQNFVTNHR